MPNLGPVEWILILLVLILLFGAKKLPDTARALGQSLKIFKKETSKEDEPAPAAQAQAQPVPPQQLPPPAPAAEEQARRLEEEAARLRAQAAKDQQRT
jgi:sec-independent protein translocase protein TatA